MDRSSEEVCDFFATLVKDHAEIEARLKELDQAALALSRAAGDAAALAVVSRTLDFFATEGARHQADEEVSLLPRLRSMPEFKQILIAMDFQHKMNDAAENELSAGVKQFVPERGRELLRLVLRFIEMHRGHMFAEERAVFPTAAAALSRDDLAAMGREMQDRRRVAPRA